ncbi:MAG: tripartite tricarboxylate transporter TctB family protein [Desulfopila sp.]
MNRTLLIGCIGLTWSVLMFTIVLPRGITMPASVEMAALSPIFWPRIVIALAGLASAVLLMQGILAKGTKRTDAAQESSEYYRWPKATSRVAIAFALILAAYLSIDFFGLVIPSILALAILMWFAGERSIFKIVTVAMLVPIMLLVFFQYVANVPIPLGDIQYILFPE